MDLTALVLLLVVQACAATCPLHVDSQGCRAGADMIGEERALAANLSKEDQVATCAQICCDMDSCDSWAVHELYTADWAGGLCVGQDCCLLKTKGWQMQPKTAALNNNNCTSGGKAPYWKGLDCNGRVYTSGNGMGLSACQHNSHPTICPWDRTAPYTALDGGGCSSDPAEAWSGEVCDLTTCKINWKGVKCHGKSYEREWTAFRYLDSTPELANAGKDCYTWGKCNAQQGPCAWCGSGHCCRYGWPDKSNGCTGTIGVEGEGHVCIDPSFNNQDARTLSLTSVPSWVSRGDYQVRFEWEDGKHVQLTVPSGSNIFQSNGLRFGPEISVTSSSVAGFDLTKATLPSLGLTIKISADEAQVCSPNGTPSLCSVDKPYTSISTSECSSDQAAPWAGGVCDTRTCTKDWRGVDCNGKLYTGGNGVGSSPCRTDGRPTICPWNQEAPYTALMFSGCSEDHTVNWPGEVCDLNTCTDPTAQLNVADGVADGEVGVAADESVSSDQQVSSDSLETEGAVHSPSPDSAGSDSGSAFPTVAIASGGAALAVVILAAVAVVWWRRRSSKKHLNDELQQPVPSTHDYKPPSGACTRV